MTHARTFLALAVLVLAGCGSGSDGSGHVLAGAAGGRGHATLDVVSGITSLTVRTADLGGDLYRVSAPDGAGIAPAVRVDGDRVEVRTVSAPGAGPAALDVRLSSGVAWRVRLAGGAQSESVDLRGGRLDGLEQTAGASTPSSCGCRGRGER
jgi:hypothetical protein